MTGDEWHDGGAAVLTDDRDTHGRGHSQSRLLGYCAASGVLGTAAATALGLAASGVTRIAVWAGVLALVSLIAGLAYESSPASFVRAVRQPQRRHRPGA
jgi:hypothetical protein